MRDQKETRPLSIDDRAATTTASADDLNNRTVARSVEEQELNAALQHWSAPSTPESLDQRVLASYRREVRRAPLWRRLLTPYLPILSLSKRGYEEANMKQCAICFEEFTEKFTFCPVDGTPLGGFAARAASFPFDSTALGFGEQQAAYAPQLNAGAGAGYHLTIIEDAGLMRRLMTELGEVAHESQLTWPEFKRDPLGFISRSASAYGVMLRRFFSSPNVAVATMTAILVMLTAVVGFIALDRHRQQVAAADRQRDDIQFLATLTDIPADQPEPEEGTAGLNKGKGGGSKPKQEKPGGGGGGGREEDKAASFGKVPEGSLDTPPLIAANPKPPPPTKDPLLVAPTLDADPLLIPRDDRPIPYGDNKSTSTDPSSGPGKGGGIGTGEGIGNGPGEGGGYGPGRGGNVGGGDRNLGGGGPGGGGGGGTDYNKIFKGSEVTSKVRILSKPEPPYTEDARKNQITGTVVLAAVFSASGQVTSIRPVSGLPHGLTEKAIAAARQIKFVPAQKDGRPVSMYYRIEYNFNLY